jgi:hypothetical protein
MLGPLPGGPTTPENITDLKLLNGLDQIRDAAIFSTSLDSQTRERVVEAADAVKHRASRPNEDAGFGADWEAVLLDTLSTQVSNEVVVKGELDEKTGEMVLRILNPYVPEKNFLAE